MQQLLPSWPLLVAFLGASLVLALTPGSGVIYVVTRTLAQGRAAGLASIAGVACGNLGNAAAAAIGLAALFAVSSLAFTVVKYAGAGYLVWLGVRALRATSVTSAQACVPAPLSRIFRDGFLVALLNPKTTIFFAAFLPQFMDPALPAALQSISLGAVFVVVAAITDAGYVLAAGMVAPLLLRARRGASAGRYLTAGTLVGLGVYTALSGEPDRR